VAMAAAAAVALGANLFISPVVAWAIPLPRAARMAVAVALLLPVGMTLGLPMPAGIRLLSRRAPQMVAWAWGINGALSVVGATLAIFIAMNWGFTAALMAAASAYAIGLLSLSATT